MFLVSFVSPFSLFRFFAFARVPIEARMRLSSTATQRAEREKNAAPLFGGAACGPLLEETFLGAPNDLRASGSQNPSVSSSGMRGTRSAAAMTQVSPVSNELFFFFFF